MNISILTAVALVIGFSCSQGAQIDVNGVIDKKAIPPLTIQNHSTPIPTNGSSTTVKPITIEPAPIITLPPTEPTPSNVTTSSTSTTPSENVTTSPTPDTTTSKPTITPPSSTTSSTATPPTSPITPSPSTGKPTEAPIITTTHPPNTRKFDGPSFLGGIVLAVGLMGIGLVVFKFYKARSERNYHTL